MFFFYNKRVLGRMVLLGKGSGDVFQEGFGARQVPGKLKNSLLAGCGISWEKVLGGSEYGRIQKNGSMNFVSIVLALAVGDEFICCFLHTL